MTGHSKVDNRTQKAVILDMIDHIDGSKREFAASSKFSENGIFDHPIKWVRGGGDAHILFDMETIIQPLTVAETELHNHS